MFASRHGTIAPGVRFDRAHRAPLARCWIEGQVQIGNEEEVRGDDSSISGNEEREAQALFFWARVATHSAINPTRCPSRIPS